MWGHAAGASGSHLDGGARVNIVRSGAPLCPVALMAQGTPFISSPHSSLLPPSSQASDHCFPEPLLDDLFFQVAYILKVAYGIVFIK